MGCKTGGMRLSPSPLALMGVYMHGIQFRHLKLRFLALMCIWMLPQLPKIAAIHRWAGDACNPRVRTGAAMSGHGWSRILSTLLLARRLKIFCSRMRSKGSRFTLGVWVLRVCSLDVAFVVATVRNRSQPSARGPYGRAYGKFYRGGPFWKFQTCLCFVSRGRRGTS